MGINLLISSYFKIFIFFFSSYPIIELPNFFLFLLNTMKLHSFDSNFLKPILSSNHQRSIIKFKNKAFVYCTKHFYYFHSILNDSTMYALYCFLNFSSKINKNNGIDPSSKVYFLSSKPMNHQSIKIKDYHFKRNIFMKRI